MREKAGNFPGKCNVTINFKTNKYFNIITTVSHFQQFMAIVKMVQQHYHIKSKTENAFI